MNKKILIFGGSGFVGTHLVKRLLKDNHEICVVCQDANKAINNIGQNNKLQVQTIDIFNNDIVASLIKDYQVIINLIGKTGENHHGYLNKFHHEFPAILANNINNKQHLIHISALLHQDAITETIYGTTKIAGENVIINKVKHYNIIRPSFIFGPDDHVQKLVSTSTKILPIFFFLLGSGNNRISPIYINDLTDSIALLIQDKQKYQNKIFEACGANITFKTMIDLLLKTMNKNRILLPINLSLIKITIQLLNKLGIYIITNEQVKLIKYDNLSSKDYDNIEVIINKKSDYMVQMPEYMHNL